MKNFIVSLIVLILAGGGYWAYQEGYIPLNVTIESADQELPTEDIWADDSIVEDSPVVNAAESILLEEDQKRFFNSKYDYGILVPESSTIVSNCNDVFDPSDCSDISIWLGEEERNLAIRVLLWWGWFYEKLSLGEMLRAFLRENGKTMKDVYPINLSFASMSWYVFDLDKILFTEKGSSRLREPISIVLVNDGKVNYMISYPVNSLLGRKIVESMDFGVGTTLYNVTGESVLFRSQLIKGADAESFRINTLIDSDFDAFDKNHMYKEWLVVWDRESEVDYYKKLIISTQIDEIYDGSTKLTLSGTLPSEIPSDFVSTISVSSCKGNFSSEYDSPYVLKSYKNPSFSYVINDDYDNVCNMPYKIVFSGKNGFKEEIYYELKHNLYVRNEQLFESVSNIIERQKPDENKREMGRGNVYESIRKYLEDENIILDDAYMDWAIINIMKDLNLSDESIWELMYEFWFRFHIKDDLNLWISYIDLKKNKEWDYVHRITFFNNSSERIEIIWHWSCSVDSPEEWLDSAEVSLDFSIDPYAVYEFYLDREDALILLNPRTKGSGWYCSFKIDGKGSISSMYNSSIYNWVDLL